MAVNFLTIAIPTFNGASTVVEALESIIPQLQIGVDILVSDNASTDETASIIRTYQEKYPIISYVCNENNLGADANFDLAIRRASGKFVWLFSDDDVMEPNAIEYVVGVLNKHPDIGCLAINYSIYSKDNKCLNVRNSPEKIDQYFAGGEEFFNAVKIAPIFCSSNIVRRSLWESAAVDHFMGSNWVHFGVMMSVALKETAYFIAEPYVRLITRATWNKVGQLFKLTLTLAKIINKMPAYGYSSLCRKKLLGCLAIPLPMTAINAKRDGISLSWQLIKNIFKEFFKDYPLRAITTIIALIIPNYFYTQAYALYKRVKRA